MKLNGCTKDVGPRAGRGRCVDGVGLHPTRHAVLMMWLRHLLYVVVVLGGAGSGVELHAKSCSQWAPPPAGSNTPRPGGASESAAAAAVAAPTLRTPA